MLYRASHCGFDTTKFHIQCDNQGPTIGIFRTNRNKIYGLYTNIPWSSAGGWPKGKKKSFKFCFNEKGLEIFKCSNKNWEVNHEKTEMMRAVCFGVTQEGQVVAQISAYYSRPPDMTDEEDQVYLAGTESPTLAELEVYKLTSNP